MHGRIGFALLTAASLILPVLLYGQSDRGQPEQGFQPIFQATKPAPAMASLTPQQPHPPWVPPPTLGFPQMAQAAGIIFSGHVTAVARSAHGNAVETVSVTFHVEQAIRGVSSGQSLTIAQWMGLWSSGQRYRVGERVLLFLYPPSKLGLTSCVGGSLGRFVVDPLGRVLFSAHHVFAFRADPILAGRSSVAFSDLAAAVRQVGERAP
jgi:hypothetical protein